MVYRLIQIILLFFSLSSCNSSFFKEDLSQILGVKKVEIENIESINEWAGIHGDGYILEIYSLSEVTIQEFKNESVKKLPKKKEEGKTWQEYDWNKNSIDSSYMEIMSLCFYYVSNKKELQTQISKMEKLIGKEEVYYSFYFRPDKQNPQNVQFFILDIESRKLYAIDQQI